MTSTAFKARPLRNAALSAVLIAALANGACARTAPLDLSRDRATEQNRYRVLIASEINPIPISRVHEWSVRLTGPDGKPVTGAIIRVDGGMPKHGHGLPTAPRVEPAAIPGDYRIRGMKFSMRGWWVLKLDIKAPGRTADKITFNVAL